MNFRNSFMMVVAVSTVLGCSGSSNTPIEKLDGDPTTTSLGMILSSPDVNAKLGSRMLAARNLVVGTTGVVLESGLVNIKEIKLELPEGMTCADAGFVTQDGISCEEEIEIEDEGEQLESEIKIMGPIVFDLISGTSTPDLSAITVPSGVYREIEIKLEQGEDGSVLDGITLKASGSYTDSENVEHSFELALEFSEEIELENSQGIEVVEGVSNTLLATLDVSAWFSGVSIDSCLDVGDDTIRIDDGQDGSSQCDSLEDDVEENIKNSLSFESEEDDDESES